MKDNFHSLIERAAHLIDIERWQAAIYLLMKARAIEPQSSYANILLSQAFLGMGDDEQGLKYANEAVSLAPDQEWGHRLRSVALLSLDRNTESLAAALEAVRIEPDDAFVLYTLAIAQLADDRTDDAGATVETLRELHPELEIAHFAAGNYYLKKGDHRSAEKSFRLALEINPLSADVRNNLAIAMMRKEERVYKPLFDASKLSILEAPDPDEVRRHLGEAIKLDPTSEVAKRNFRNQFRYAFPIYLAVALLPYGMMVLFVNPAWAIIWTIIFLVSIVQAFRQVRTSRNELADDLKPILENLPRLSLNERLSEIADFFQSYARKTWPAHATALIAVFLRHTNFGGGPPPTGRSTWNVAVSYLVIFGSTVWLGYLMKNDDE